MHTKALARLTLSVCYEVEDMVPIAKKATYRLVVWFQRSYKLLRTVIMEYGAELGWAGLGWPLILSFFSTVTEKLTPLARSPIRAGETGGTAPRTSITANSWRGPGEPDIC